MSKYYVVWKGRKPGVYPTWDQCKAQTDHFPGARFKSYPSQTEAQNAYKGERGAKKKYKGQLTIIEEMQILLERVVTELQIYRMRYPKEKNGNLQRRS